MPDLAPQEMEAIRKLAVIGGWYPGSSLRALQQLLKVYDELRIENDGLRAQIKELEADYA